MRRTTPKRHSVSCMATTASWHSVQSSSSHCTAGALMPLFSTSMVRLRSCKQGETGVGSVVVCECVSARAPQHRTETGT
jgi:hypothetical protein